MEFQGLQNNLPSIITVIISLLICVLSWYSYRKYSSISLWWKLTLSVLRATSLCILLFLFMNPFFKQSEEVKVKPKIAVLLDGSESTTINKGEYNGYSSYQSTIAALRDTPNEVELTFFSFGNSLQDQDASDFSPTQPTTNLFAAIETITTSDEDYSSAILISDGIITQGKNPIFESRNSSFPIHVIGIGDTSKVKDLSIENISTNATGFTNTNHIIDIDIAQFGFDNQRIEVKLASDNTIIDSRNLTISEDKEIESIQFEIELNSPGLKQYKIEIEPILEEWSTENNNSTFAIEILDSKKKILHIASSIHPDVKALRSILTMDQNIELSTYTFLNKSKSLKEIIPTDNYDLIIFHGDISNELLSQFEIDEFGSSSLFIALPKADLAFDSNRFKLISNNSNSVYEVQLVINTESSDHPILELPEINFNSSAPIQSSINSLNDYPEAISLFTSSYQNINSESPLLSILEQGNVRRSHFNAFGWYKMYLSPNYDERAYIEDLLTNIVDWTSSDPDNRLLKIKPTKNEFNTSEPSIINASLINENGEIESSAIIEVTITGENYTANFNMDNLNNGNYRLQTPNLPDGQYTFKGVARKGNREIDAQNGEFLVNESNIELSNTIRNQDILKAIASNSGGSFFDFQNIESFWSNPEIAKQLIIKTETQERYIFPVRSIYWFILVLLLLGSEWFLRKKFALP